ncbi:MAG: hypothetical protein E6R14_08975 [Thermomicrobiales bacterium]|nr:MAG: hypothetical protein E6R14_08975 [Thermomicrobiales bacterium]
MYLIGKFYGIDLQDSLSAYYWASGFESSAPVRVWFVGGLFAIGVFLYLYKGFSVGENNALNLAAIFAIGVAVCPMEWPVSNSWFSAHGTCAGLLFACLGYVAIFRSRDTLPYLQPAEGRSPRDHDKRLRVYRWVYYVSGSTMWILPLTVWALAAGVGRHHAWVFFLEWAGVFAFSFFWGVKSWEMHTSRVIRRVLRGEPNPKAPDSVEWSNLLPSDRIAIEAAWMSANSPAA